ncbi:MAG: DUF6276 family protein [Halodesulfurarchaeum sp.]
MSCPNCGAETLAFPVPASIREHLPDDRAGARLCQRCLTVTPADDPPADYPDFTAIADAFPRDGETAAILASMLALVDAIALYREEVEALATQAEVRGVDVMLALDRLAATAGVEPHFDVGRRKRQLEQLLD